MRYFLYGLSGQGLLNTSGGLSGRAQALFGGLSLGEKEKGNKMSYANGIEVMETATQPTCEERISVEMAQLEELLTQLENDPESDELSDPALSVDTERFTRVCLSWGGPSEYLEIYWSEEGIRRVVYRFSDWFDTATREVEEDSVLWRYADLIVESEGN